MQQIHGIRHVVLGRGWGPTLPHNDHCAPVLPFSLIMISSLLCGKCINAVHFDWGCDLFTAWASSRPRPSQHTFGICYCLHASCLPHLQCGGCWISPSPAFSPLFLQSSLLSSSLLPPHPPLHTALTGDIPILAYGSLHVVVRSDPPYGR